MSMRDKDQADFDLETFVDLFDTAISSDNPAVQRALKNLLMIAALVNAENTEAGMQQGPLRRVIEDQKHIIRRLNELETKSSWNTPGQYSPMPVPSRPAPLQSPTIGPTWPNPVTNPGMVPPGTIWTTNTSGSSYTIPDSGAKSLATQAHMAVASLDGFLDKLETKQ